MSTIVDGLRSRGVRSRVEAVGDRLPIGCDDFICCKALCSLRVGVVDIGKSSVPNPDAEGCGLYALRRRCVVDSPFKEQMRPRARFPRLNCRVETGQPSPAVGVRIPAIILGKHRIVVIERTAADAQGESVRGRNYRQPGLCGNSIPVMTRKVGIIKVAKACCEVGREYPSVRNSIA